MALFWLVNPVVIDNLRKLPGHSVNSDVESIAAYEAAGALLWPQGDPTVDAAAAKTTNYRLNRGANEATLESIMQSAVNKVQLQEEGDDIPPTRTLTAGTGLTGGGDLSVDRTFNVGANADGSIVVNPNDIQVGVLATDAQHGVRAGGTQHAVAVASVSAGFISAAGQATLEAAVPNTRTLTAGAGLTGGGDLSANRTLDVVANADGSIVANANDIQVGILATDAQHGVRGGGTQHAAATIAVAGFLSAADKTRFEGLFSVANKAALALVDGATLDDHISRFVGTYQQWWLLDKTSALALVDDMIINAVGGGQWLRQIAQAPHPTNRLVWGVDTVAGNDENRGADTAGNRLKTLSEVARRLACFNFADYTINVIGTVAATDKPKWSGKILSEGTPADARQMVIATTGVRTPVAGFLGGTIGTATATDIATSPSTGLSQAMITDAAIADWTPYANPAVTTASKLLVITSGPNAGLTAWTLFANPAAASSVLNGGVDPTRVRVSNWHNATTAAIGATAAATSASAAVVAALSGQTYSINDVSSYLAPNNANVGLANCIRLQYKDFQFSTLFGAQRGDGIVTVITTRHIGAGGGGAVGSFFASEGGTLQANGSLVHFTALATVSSRLGAYELNGCAFVNVRAVPNGSCFWSVGNLTLQSSLIQSGVLAGGVLRPGVLGNLSVNGTYGIGAYDPPTAESAIAIRRGATLATESVLHGFGAIAGSLSFLHVTDGGTAMIKTGITPTGTNTGAAVPAQVRLDESATFTALQSLEAAIPGVQVGTATLVAGTVTIPALISATSRIKPSRNTPIGAVLGSDLSAPSASRTPGSPGSFVVNAIDLTGATVATDASTIDWEVVNDPPIGVPLSTWAEWAAAVVPHISGFGRNVISQTDGSKIIDFTGAN